MSCRYTSLFRSGVPSLSNSALVVDMQTDITVAKHNMLYNVHLHYLPQFLYVGGDSRQPVDSIYNSMCLNKLTAASQHQRNCRKHTVTQSNKMTWNLYKFSFKCFIKMVFRQSLCVWFVTHMSCSVLFIACGQKKRIIYFFLNPSK